MGLRCAKSVDEYVEWVRQAVLDVADLRDCLEFGIEDLNKPPVFLDPLEEGIEETLESMKAGTYSFGREDLPFMGRAGKYAGAIPFHTLLNQIDETHRRGLDVPTDDA